jgi:transcriptional regulator with GAF, ATPase, and Fis domain
LAARAVTVVEMHVWCQRCGAGLGAEFDALAQALSTHDIALTTPGAPGDASAGLVLFETVDSDVIDVLRDRSAGATVRVIAVHAGGVALPAAQHWNLLAAGAADVIAMPAAIDAAAACAARLRRWEQIDALMTSPLVSRNLVGASPAWCRVLRQVIEVASFTDASALIVGESGTGKELIARLIHTLDARREKGELVVLDCSTVVGDLAGSEFFGHERGAFTGATGPREGAFALADGGTLFLDEVGELPLSLQPQLLRVVQERSFKRVGGSRWDRTNFRLVCATHRELLAEVERGAFRADLYHRLAACVFHLPPLRDRPEDIVPLALRFLAEARPGRPPLGLQAPVRDYLLRRRFPGNVRELRQLMARIASRHVGDAPVTVGDIPEDERPSDTLPTQDWRGLEFEQAIRRALCQGVGLRDISQCAAEAAIRVALSEEAGNLQRAAGRLGVTDRALQLRRAGRATGL